MVECKFTLSDAQMRIRGLYDVVNDYRGMCDAHCVDYITEDHWNMLVPHEWQDDLLHIGGGDDWISYFLHPNKLLHPCTVIIIIHDVFDNFIGCVIITISWLLYPL
jgi:hypothetical protein